MTKTISLLITIIFAGNIFAQEIATFTDKRDGEIYKTVKIGNQVWMAENIRYKANEGHYFIYKTNKETNIKNGYLYNWTTAQKVCPTDWKLPSENDFKSLINYYKNDKGKNATFKSITSNNNNSFSALLSGYRDYKGFVHKDKFSLFWSSTDITDEHAWLLSIEKKKKKVWTHPYHTKGVACSIRCLKDE